MLDFTTRKSKKIRDFTGLNDKKRVSNNNTRNLGFGNRKIIEPVPNYIQSESEKVISNDNNAWVVLGRDRPSNLLSGYGGKGYTGAGSVDIVAGRMSADPRSVNEEGEKVYVDPNFKADAARVHVSQKTDIDDNFELADGTIGNSKGYSGVGLKADGVRVIGRQGIKLVTGTDPATSQGSRVSSISGIDLIAGNDDSDLQPIPKGDNLRDALLEVMENVENLQGIIETFVQAQISFNSAMAGHTHPTPTGPSGPSPTALAAGTSANISETLNSFSSMPSQRINTANFKMKYCKPTGDKFINSRHNNTN